MKLLACDPGCSGGFAFIGSDGYVGSEPMPKTDGDIIELAMRSRSDLGIDRVIIEDIPKFVSVIPGARVAVMFRNFGFLIGAFMALGFRVELVRPQVWQKALGLGTRPKNMTKTQWKNKLKNKAQQLYPNQDITLATSDAFLLLEYALKYLRGGE